MVSIDHSASITRTRTTPTMANGFGYDERPDRAHAVNPIAAPKIIPVSLMHTGRWEPLSMKVLEGSWWHRISPIAYGIDAAPCPLHHPSIIPGEPPSAMNVPYGAR